MAPDLNSLPASPRPVRSPISQQSSQSSSVAVSRRTSQQMPPPPPPAVLNSHRGSTTMSSEHVEVPLRHPRPLTAAEVYLECEKEQEAVVNRLTRELSALRAQAASVASNASQSSISTSASLLPVDITDPNPTHQLTGATHPTPSRRHRSSSSLSARSLPNASAAAGTTPVSQPLQSHNNLNGTSAPSNIVSQASTDRAVASSNTQSRRQSANVSGASTPARQSLDMARYPHVPSLSTRPSISRDPSYISQLSTAAQAGTPTSAPIPSPALSPGHHSAAAPLHSPEITAATRTEVDTLRAENEALRQRVRALERALRTRRRDSSTSETARTDVVRIASPAEARSLHSPAGVAAWAAGDGGVGGVAGPRERSESQSTTASSRRGLPVEDEVRLGESAGSIGIGRGL